MRTYFKGTSGLTEVFDANGEKINVGDKLSHDFEDSAHWFVDAWKKEATYIVMAHPKGGFCAIGINEKLYLHDFRFKFTHKINPL